MAVEILYFRFETLEEAVTVGTDIFPAIQTSDHLIGTYRGIVNGSRVDIHLINGASNTPGQIFKPIGLTVDEDLGPSPVSIKFPGTSNPAHHINVIAESDNIATINSLLSGGSLAGIIVAPANPEVRVS